MSMTTHQWTRHAPATVLSHDIGVGSVKEQEGVQGEDTLDSTCSRSLWLYHPSQLLDSFCFSMFGLLHLESNLVDWFCSILSCVRIIITHHILSICTQSSSVPPSVHELASAAAFLAITTANHSTWVSRRVRLRQRLANECRSPASKFGGIRRELNQREIRFFCHTSMKFCWSWSSSLKIEILPSWPPPRARVLMRIGHDINPEGVGVFAVPIVPKLQKPWWCDVVTVFSEIFSSAGDNDWLVNKTSILSYVFSIIKNHDGRETVSMQVLHTVWTL